ncbi:MAG: FAD-dependent oxidoreductase, partial [Lautropia sp.]
GAAVAGTAAGAAGSAAIDAAAFAGRVDVPAPVAVVDLPAASEVGRRYDARAGTVYLFRPDGHVLARWRAADPARVAAAITQCLQGGNAVTEPA